MSMAISNSHRDEIIEKIAVASGLRHRDGRNAVAKAIYEQIVAPLENEAYDYAARFQRAQDALKHVAIMIDDDKKRIADLEREKGNRGEGWRPDADPITGHRFFMWIAHPDKGMVPTYGGPYDSYTLAERDKDGSYWVERYDHDMGSWRGHDMGIEDCGVQVVDDQLYVSEEDPDDLKAEITELRAKLAMPVRLPPPDSSDRYHGSLTRFAIKKAGFAVEGR